MQSRRGGGMRVVDVFPPTLTDPLVHLLKSHRGAIADILELRHALEEVAAYYAPLRATNQDLRELKRRFAILKATHRQGEAVQGADADVDFHMAVAEASHNLPRVYVMRGLFNLLRSVIVDARERIWSQPEYARIIHGQHDAIYRAVLKRDAQAARSAAHLHLAFIDASLAQLDADATARRRHVARARPTLPSRKERVRTARAA